MTAGQGREWSQLSEIWQGPPEGMARPKITIEMKVEITGEWVTPGMVAGVAERLAGTMAARLREAAAAEASRAAGGGGGAG
jgi:hypothetical protein